MSFQLKQKNKDLSLSQETQARTAHNPASSAAHGAFEDASNSSQLQSILGRINSILNDEPVLNGGSVEGQAGGLTDGASEFNRDTNASLANNFQTAPHPGALTDRSVSASYQNSGARLSHAPDRPVAGRGDKFQASEPLDMLQPYSEVLNEVRDYFNDRNSLDPNDGLVNSQKSHSISERFLAGSSLQNEINKPKKDMLWTEASLDAQSPNVAGSALHKNNSDESPYGERAKARRRSSVPIGEEASKLSPADFGFGQSQERTSFQDNKALFGEDRSSLNKPSQIFSPLKFSNPFERERPLVDAGDPSGQFNQLRHELIDRISQLEQVLGHHFGDRKEIANEAAQAAMKLAISDLDDTALGRRLADVETALVLYQKQQTQKTQEIQDTIESLGQALLKIEAMSRGRIKPGNGQKTDQSNVPLTPPHPVGRGEEAGPLMRPPVSVEKNKTPNKTVGDYETQLPTGKRAGTPVPDIESAGLGNENANLSTRISAIQPLSEGPPPLFLSETSDNSNGEVSKDADADAIRKFSQAMAKSASQRSFGKADTEMGIDTMTKETSDTSLDEKSEGQQKRDGFSEDLSDASGDDYLDKSATLRKRFSGADMVSNDSDLHNMEQKAVRPVVIVAVVALLLAATGIAFQGNAKGFQQAISNIIASVNGVLGQKEAVTPLADTTPHSGKSNKDQNELGVKLLDEGKLKGRLGSLKTVDDRSASIVNKDPDVTGNIGVKKSKPGHSLDEAILEKEGVKLGMPPALIGPYSLRLAASRGDVRAEYEVARRFSYGLGVPKDHEQAVKWYMQGASKGFAPSQYRLATYYERGLGIDKNLGRAKSWYQRAARLGNVKAMHNLAVIDTALYKKEADYKMAVYWFKQAANRNLADSQFNLAILYQNGVGLKKDTIESYKWFSLAARQGDIDAASRRDLLEKKLSKEDLLRASQLLLSWKPLAIESKANDVGGISPHLTSTMSHAQETITRSRVLTAQILLRKLGYGLKSTGGAMNEETIRAIKKFEKDKGLPITGKISSDLIRNLNRASL